MKTKIVKALIGTIPSVFEFLSGTKKSGNDTMASVLNSSLQSSKHSNTALPQNSFKASAELVKAVGENTDNPRDMIIVMATLSRLEN